MSNTGLFETDITKPITVPKNVEDMVVAIDELSNTETDIDEEKAIELLSTTVKKANLSKEDIDYILSSEGVDEGLYMYLIPVIEHVDNLTFDHLNLFLALSPNPVYKKVEQLSKKTQGAFNKNYIYEQARVGKKGDWGVRFMAQHCEDFGISLTELTKTPEGMELYGDQVILDRIDTILELPDTEISRFLSSRIIEGGWLVAEKVTWVISRFKPLHQKLIINTLLESQNISNAELVLIIIEAQSVYDPLVLKDMAMRATLGFFPALTKLPYSGVAIDVKPILGYATKYANWSRIIEGVEAFSPLEPINLGLAYTAEKKMGMESNLQRLARNFQFFSLSTYTGEHKELVSTYPTEIAVNLSRASDGIMQNTDFKNHLAEILISEDRVTVCIETLLEYSDYAGLGNLIEILSTNSAFNLSEYKGQIIAGVSSKAQTLKEKDLTRIRKQAINLLKRLDPNTSNLIDSKEESGPSLVGSERYKPVFLDREVLLFYIARGIKSNLDSFESILLRPGNIDSNGLVTESREPTRVYDRALVAQARGVSTKQLEKSFSWIDQYLLDALYSELKHQDDGSYSGKAVPLSDPYRVPRIPNIYTSATVQDVQEFCFRASVKFNQKRCWEGSSLGGHLWSKIADYAGKIWDPKLDPDTRTFLIDRIIDHHHNGGHIFDKDPRVQSSSKFQELLDLKAHTTTDELIRYGIENKLLTPQEVKEFRQAVEVTSKLDSMPTRRKGYD